MSDSAHDAPAARDLLGEVVRALPVAVYTTDAAGFLTFFNQAAADLAGRSPTLGQDRWCVTWRLYWPDGRRMAHDECPMAIALRENRIIRGAQAIAERPDGTRFTFTPYPTPIRDTAGAVVAGINVLIDLTDHPTERTTAGGAPFAAAGDPRKRLFDVLRLVETILTEAEQRAQGAEARALAAWGLQRILALSATQGFLSHLGGESRISSWDLLSAACMSDQAVLPSNVELQCASTVADLASETAMPLALLVRELIANAIKHAHNGAAMAVRLALNGRPGGYTLSVEVEGPGFAPGPEFFRCLDTGLIKALAQQIDGTLETERDTGVRCVVRVPDLHTIH